MEEGLDTREIVKQYGDLKKDHKKLIRKSTMEI